MSSTQASHTSYSKSQIMAHKQVDDGASMASTSTFASTVSLLKNKVPTSYKEHKARKQAKLVPQSSNLAASETEKKKSKRQPLPKADWESKARTNEAYLLHAMLK